MSSKLGALGLCEPLLMPPDRPGSITVQYHACTAALLSSQHSRARPLFSIQRAPSQSATPSTTQEYRGSVSHKFKTMFERKYFD